MAVAPIELARIAALAADEKKATNIVVLDLTSLSDVCDFFVICSAANARMLDSVVDEVEERIKKNTGLGPLSHEGRAGASWVLLDYGSVVVHAFLPETRDYYRLERLWGDAPQVDMGLESSSES
ncbi:MAG: ribosome silencing factor [Atopobiaceae bacterium]|nr:ribosome silencing factor [Atopobiaceae bacterium]